MKGNWSEALVEAAMAYNLLAKRTIFAARGGLTKEQVLVVNALRQSGPIWMSELSSRLAIPKEQASRAVSALEESGLVSRGPVEGNRRAVAVELTIKGRAFLEDIHAEIDGLLEDDLAGLTDEEMHKLAEAAKTSASLLVKALV